MRYKTKLIKSETVAEGTMAFWFEKPAGYESKAGQHIDLTLPEIEENHTFSLASAPYESELMIASRMRDTTFKNTLKGLKPDAEVEITHAHGNLILHLNSSKPAVFLAGGIGITPFRSMILQATRENKPHQMYLFYSNRTPELAAFLDELAKLADQSETFTLIPTMTDAKNWMGKTGYINREMITKFVTDLPQTLYYMAGPPNFVAAMRQLAESTGAPDDFIKTEQFSGY